MTQLRRAVTVPVATVVMLAVLIFGPALMALAGVAGVVARSTRPARTLAVAFAYATLELQALARLLRGGQDGDALMREFLGKAYAAARRILDVEVLVEQPSTRPDQVSGDKPVIVLSRHCGPGDSVLVAWLLAVYYRLRIRIVLKAVLRCEPALDLAGDLNCLCFLNGRTERACGQIRDAAASLSGGQALLLFPEGGNFTWARWRRAIIRLRESGRLREARRAWRQSHTLPPHTRGTAAALAGAPHANVMVLTHNGFCPDGRSRPWWRLPIHRQLVVRTALIPAARLPSPDQLGAWLEETWAQVDAWVAEHTDAE